jgi:ferric-dicitrate binding protein FerR (iron transport regulator)
MKYTDYAAEDFVMDKGFRKWVQDPHPEICLFWKNWLSLNPGKASEVEKARQMILLAQFEHFDFSEADMAEVWNNISRERHNRQRKETSPGKAIHLWGYWQKLAAVLVLLSIVGMSYFLINNYYLFTRYSTEYGKTETIALPDGSTITLNAHSEVKFANNWDSKQVREVWLNGEAFFSVVPEGQGPGGIKLR